jgi:hypothetical protein
MSAQGKQKPFRKDMPARTGRRNPDALRELMERMRVEVANELGMSGVQEESFGDTTTAVCGRFGALLYKRARMLLEEAPDNTATSTRKIR